jgi:hypothetical protein
MTSLAHAKGYYPTLSEINYPSVVSAGSNYCDVIKSSPPNTTIKLQPGTYGKCSFSNKNNITILADPGTVTINQGTGQGDAAFNIANSHHINIVGLNFNNANILFLGGYTDTSHHIYMGGLTATNIDTTGIFTGPNSHDITLDKSTLTGFNGGGYGWYGLGYHIAVTNNYFKGASNFTLVLRGYHPLNKQTGWSYNARDPIRNNLSAYEQLPADEWSFYVANNEFADKNKNIKGGDSNRGAHIGFYSAWNNSGDPDDEQYFPSQNNIIENNVFYNAAIKDKDGSISLTHDYGFPQGADGKSVSSGGKTVVRGSIIQNNYTDQPLLRQYDNPNLDLISLANNKEGMSINELKALGEKVRAQSPPDSPIIPYGEIIPNSTAKGGQSNNQPTPTTNGYLPISVHFDEVIIAGEKVDGKFPNETLETLKDQRVISDWNVRLNRRMAEYYTMKVVNQSYQIPKRYYIDLHNNITKDILAQKKLTKDGLILQKQFKLIENSDINIVNDIFSQ